MKPTVWAAIVKQLLALLGQDESVIEYVKDRAGHDRRYAINFDKIKHELGWEPSVDLETGLVKTVKWFKENESWWKNVKSGEYQKYYETQYGK